MKKLLLALLVIVLVAAGALAAFLLTFDVNRYKDELIALVERQSGRSFAIDGELGLKLSLIPTVTVQGVRLGNAGWGSAPDMIRIAHFEAQAALLPLLERRVVIRRLYLRDAEVVLERNADGDANWTVGASARESTLPAPAAGLPAFEIEQVSVEDTTVRYHAGTDVPAREIHLKALHTSAADRTTAIALDMQGSVDGRPISLTGTLGTLAALADVRPLDLDLVGQSGGVRINARGSVALVQAAQLFRLDVELAADTIAALGGAAAALPAVGPVAVAVTLTADERGYVFDGLHATIGRSALAGSGVLALAMPRAHLRGGIEASLLDLTELLPGGSDKPPGKGERLFPGAPLPTAALRAIDLDFDVQADRVIARDFELAALEARVLLANGRLRVDPLRADSAGGVVEMKLDLDAAGDLPAVALEMRGRTVVAGQVPKLLRAKLVQGGPMDFDIAIKGQGRSVAAIMAGADGRVRMKIGAATMANKTAGVASADAVFDGLRLLNPLASSDPKTHIECAVVNFPISQGVAANDTGIALQTDKLNILGGGRIDLQTEAIDIGAKPKPRAGVGLNLASIGDFVRLGGTLAEPRVVTDAAGAATAGIKVGAAVATGGLSILAEGLFDRATVDDDVCAVALGDKKLRQAQAKEPTSAQQQPSALDKAGDVVKGAGETVKGVFKGLFGR
ncbi:MAG: AsmA family protein [Gammaproteobacteria bacterium]|nr:AsmA family protein [Gammaproteobacteria bacterium]